MSDTTRLKDLQKSAIPGNPLAELLGPRMFEPRYSLAKAKSLGRY